jgi:folate-binding protein YgfZ
MAESVNPLLELHRQADAETQQYGPIEIVSTFGQPQAEYAAIRKGAAMIDLPQRTFIELRGAGRLSFLNNLLTNQTFDKNAKQPLAGGRGVYAMLLQAKSGRVITDVNVLELGDRTLLEVEGRVAAGVIGELERYIFTEKVQVRHLGGEVHLLALHGPMAGAVIEEAANGAAVATGLAEPLSSVRLMLFGHETIIYRDDPCGVSGLYLIVPAAGAQEVWMKLLTASPVAARPIGWAAFNAARIEGGRALFGIDFDENFLPAETGQLERAVSFTKGCYPGQEIVARMHARKQLARKVAGFRMKEDAQPIAGAPIHDSAGNQVGAVTSSTPSPMLSGASIGLAVLKRPHFEVGNSLQIAAEGAMREAMVVELPFISAGKRGATAI